MSMPLRLAVFDVDGTIVDSQAHIVAAMARALESVGRAPLPKQDVLSIVGLSLPEAFSRLLPEADARENEALVHGYKSAFVDLRAAGQETRTMLYPGMRETLQDLNACDDLLLGVATGKSRRGLERMLDTHQLRGLFLTTQVADDHPSKPHPSMLEEAMRQTGCAPEDTVMIGDTTYDMEMAKAAGVASIGVGWGYHAVDALHRVRPDAVVDTAAELSHLVRDLLGI